MALWWILGSREKRDMEAAQMFFKQALAVVGRAPERVTTDGHASYPRAVRETLGDQVLHRTNTYLNNRLEQDHRGVKQRYYPMHGFGNFDSAARFCCAAGRITELSPSSQDYGRTGFTFRTATNSPQSAYPFEGFDASFLSVRGAHQDVLKP